MSAWLSALGAAAESGSGILASQMKADAEARARDQQADIEERLAAARDLRAERAQQRGFDHSDKSQERSIKASTESQERGILASKDAQVAGFQNAEVMQDKSNDFSAKQQERSQSFQAGQANLSRAQSKELAEMAQNNNWHIDEKGYYVKPDGTHPIDQYTKNPIKAPANKVDSKPNDWMLKENLDAINREIEKARSMGGDKKLLAELLAEKDKLMGKKTEPAANDPFNIRKAK